MVSNCLLQRPLDLGGGVQAEPLSEAMSFRGEIEYVLRNAATLGFTPDATVKPALIADMERCTVEPMVVLRFPSIDAAGPPEVEAAVLPAVDIACATLTLVTANASTPIAVVLVTGMQSWVRMLPPPQPRIHHPEDVVFVHGGVGHRVKVPTYLDVAPIVHAAALSSPSIALMCRMLHVAQQARQAEFRIFHHLQLLEMAADGYSGTLAERLRALWAEMEVLGELQSIPARLGLALPPDKDFTDVLVKLRNAMAHDGCINTTSVQAAYVDPFLAKVDELARAIRELARIVVADRAGAGPRHLHARIAYGPDGVVATTVKPPGSP